MRYLADAELEEFFYDFSQRRTTTELFRKGMRRFASGVTVVTSRRDNGDPVGMTATAVCSLSASPPSLLVCAYGSGSLAQSVRRTWPFCVNVLAAHHEDVARACSTGAPGHERFDAERWTIDARGVPVLNDALARFECQVIDLVPIATHLLIVGQITEVMVPDEDRASLVYRDGQFKSVE